MHIMVIREVVRITKIYNWPNHHKRESKMTAETRQLSCGSHTPGAWAAVDEVAEHFSRGAEKDLHQNEIFRKEVR